VELVCEKYKEYMDSENAECRHPNDYCQTRTSCMICFIEKERKREESLLVKKGSQGKLL